MYMCVQEGTLEMWVPVVARAAASLFFSSTSRLGMRLRLAVRLFRDRAPAVDAVSPQRPAATGGGGDPVENNKAGSRLAVRAWGGVGSPLFSWMPHWIGRRGASREECSSVLV